MFHHVLVFVKLIPKQVIVTAAVEPMRKKKNWKDEKTTNEWKKNNLIEIQKRLNGWQLESFKESYKNKINCGISLYKKANLK